MLTPSLICRVQGPGTIFLLPLQPGSLPKPSSVPSSLAVACAVLGWGWLLQARGCDCGRGIEVRRAPWPRGDTAWEGCNALCCQCFTQMLNFLQELPSSDGTEPCPKSLAVTQKGAGLLPSWEAAAFGALYRDTGEALVGSQGAVALPASSRALYADVFHPRKHLGLLWCFWGDLVWIHRFMTARKHKSTGAGQVRL